MNTTTVLDRMKNLEREYRTNLPDTGYAVIRVDGKGFSKYTRGLRKPFDGYFTADMIETTLHLCENIDGALYGYTQSDEISIILDAPATEKTQRWFGGQIQKIVSISAAMATAKFGSLRADGQLPIFDGRTHHLEDADAVREYLSWRQRDAVKNSVSMLASHHFSHRELQGVPTGDRRQMLAAKGIIWEDLEDRFKGGTLVSQFERPRTVTYQDKRTGKDETVHVVRNIWEAVPAPDFRNALPVG